MNEEAGAPPVVYTALFGRYEPLTEQPIALLSACRFICFTDDPSLSSATWEIVHRTPMVVGDPTRSARVLKILGDPILEEYEVSLWIDNRILLTEDPQTLVPRLLGSADIALPIHSFRDTVADEFEAVLQHGFDRPYIVREELSVFARHDPGILLARPYWTAILVRRNVPVIREAMLTWICSVLRYSRRDQLSINYSLASTGVVVHELDIDNFRSDFHEWLELPKRNSILRTRGYKYVWQDRARDYWLTSRLRRLMRRAQRMVHSGLGSRR